MRAPSIISTKKKCYICGSQQHIELHHVYGGPNRKVSDKNGFTVYLCHTCHLEVTDKVNEKDKHLKRLCQYIYESKHTRYEFMQLIGRNYLDDDADPNWFF